MIGKMLAVIAAVACAGITVGFIPSSAPAWTGGTSIVIQSKGTDSSNSSKIAEAAAGQQAAGIRNTICTQSWPYYEPSCLREGTAPGHNPRVVRVVTADRAVTGSISQAQR